MKSTVSQLRKCAVGVQNVVLALLLCLGLLVAALFAPRAMAEEEVETPTWVHVLREQHCITRSPLARLPIPVIVRPQGRAVERGPQARHTNNEQSKRNGSGCYLLI
jgi:hypothetical protein